MSDNTKYPYTKAEGKEKETMKRVYAAPIRRRRQAEKCVYAGPEYFAKKNGQDKPFEGVYAGPDYSSGIKIPPIQAVYAAPARPDAEMEEVYAGPEYFEKAVRPDPALTMMVYAGPEYFANSPAPAMPVYAGPEYFSGQESKIGARICSNCGTALWPEYNFCPECGAPVAKEE